MRDPARIDPILDAIRDMWKANPDLRLGQLIVNAIHPQRECSEIFYAEDDRLLAGLCSRQTPPERSEYQTVVLDQSEAIVLFGILLRYDVRQSLRVDGEAERQVLLSMLEAVQNSLGSVLATSDLQPLIEQAKRQVLGQPELS